MVRKLPKGWAHRVLGNCIESIESGVSVNGEDRPASSTETGVLKVSAVSDGRFFPGQNKKVVANELVRARLNPSAGSLIVSRANTPELVGAVAYVEEDHPNLFLSDKLWQIRLPKSGPIAPQWLNAVLSSQFYRKQLMELATGSSKSMQNISQASFLALEVPAPGLDEQRRIVCVLDAADRQIDLAEKIAKETADQSAAIASKLIASIAGKQVDLAQVVSRVRRPPTNADVVPLTISAESGLVPQSTFFGRRVASDVIDSYTLIRRGEFAYNKSYSNGYPYGAIKRLEDVEEGVLSSLYLCFGADDQDALDGNYLAAVCESGFFNRQIHMIAHEGARNHGLLNVSAEDFFSMRLPLPNQQEQKRIADAVRAARARVQQSRERVESLQRQKRALMQKLLTGQQRLTRDLPGMESGDV